MLGTGWAVPRRQHVLIGQTENFRLWRASILSPSLIHSLSLLIPVFMHSAWCVILFVCSGVTCLKTCARCLGFIVFPALRVYDAMNVLSTHTFSHTTRTHTHTHTRFFIHPIPFLPSMLFLTHTTYHPPPTSLHHIILFMTLFDKGLWLDNCLFRSYGSFFLPFHYMHAFLTFMYRIYTGRFDTIWVGLSALVVITCCALHCRHFSETFLALSLHNMLFVHGQRAAFCVWFGVHFLPGQGRFIVCIVGGQDRQFCCARHLCCVCVHFVQLFGFWDRTAFPFFMTAAALLGSRAYAPCHTLFYLCIPSSQPREKHARHFPYYLPSLPAPFTNSSTCGWFQGVASSDGLCHPVSPHALHSFSSFIPVVELQWTALLSPTFVTHMAGDWDLDRCFP